MAIVLTIAFTAIYTFILLRWNKVVSWRLSSKVTNAIKHIHYLALFVSMAIAFTYSQFGIGLRGLWTTRSIIIIVLVTGIFFYFVANKTALQKTEKIYFKLFSFIPTLIGIILCIPFLGVIIVVSLLGRLIEPANNIYYQDKHLRIQSAFTGVLAPPRVDIYTKHGIFEKHIYRPDFYGYEFDSISVRYDPDSTRIIVHGLPKEDYKPKVISLSKLD